MKKLITEISFVIILVFSVVGFLVFSTLLHEYIHKIDFSEIIVNGTDETCILNAPNFSTIGSLVDTPVGYFRFETNNETRYREIKKYSEVKAYAVDLLLIGVFVTGFLIVFINWIDKNGKNKNNQ